MTIAKASSLKKKLAKEDASSILIQKLQALPEFTLEEFIRIVYDKTVITEVETSILNNIIQLDSFEYNIDEEYSLEKYEERSKLLTDPGYLKAAKEIYKKMSINREIDLKDPLVAVKTNDNYDESILQLTFESFGINSLFKALPLRTPQNKEEYEHTTKLLLSNELSVDSISKEAIADAYIKWFNGSANDKKIIEKFLSALNESDLYLSSQENAEDRSKYYSENYLARLIKEISKYDEANMPDYFKKMISYLNPEIIWENSVKSGNFIVYHLLSQSVDFSSCMNDEGLVENIKSLFQSCNNRGVSAFYGVSSIAPSFLLNQRQDYPESLDAISLLMKLMKDINKMDISTVEMIVSNKHRIEKKYVQEFIKCLLDKNYDFKSIMPTSWDLIRETLLKNDNPKLFVALLNKYNLSEVSAEDIATYVKELISSKQHYKADLLLTSGVLVTKVSPEDIIAVSRNLSKISDWNNLVDCLSENQKSGFATDNELYESEIKKLFALADYVKEFSHETALLGNNDQLQEHIDYSSSEYIYSQLS